MKSNSVHILIFLLCVSFVVTAQEQGMDAKLDFYLQMAYRDAQYEQTLSALGVEDQADYWKDQRAFERELLHKTPDLHQAYINGKHIAYGQHQKRCGTQCGHSDMYLRQASYYAVMGVFQVPTNTALSSKEVKLSKISKTPER